MLWEFNKGSTIWKKKSEHLKSSFAGKVSFQEDVTYKHRTKEVKYPGEMGRKRVFQAREPCANAGN